MPINYNKLDEGDQLNADSLNDRFDSIAGTGPDRGLNNLGQADVERYALRREHLPSLITSADFPNGLSKVGPLSKPLATQNYEAFLNRNTIGVPAGYLTIFGTTGIVVAPYGPTVGFDDGWRIPATDGVVANAAEINFPALISNGSSSIGDYTGLLVRLGICLDSANSYGNVQSREDVPSVVVGIGWTDDSGGANPRAVIGRSIRWSNVNNRVKGSLDTFTYITPSDIPAGVGIQSVFGVIAGANLNETNAQTPKPRITFYNLDIIPIRAGVLEIE